MGLECFVHIDEDTPATKILRELLKRYHGETESTITHTKYGNEYLYGPHQAMVGLGAVKLDWYDQCYEHLNSVAVKEYGLDRMSYLDTLGLSAGGGFTDYPGDRLFLNYVRKVMIRGGKIVPLSGWIEGPPIPDFLLKRWAEWAE